MSVPLDKGNGSSGNEMQKDVATAGRKRRGQLRMLDRFL